MRSRAVKRITRIGVTLLTIFGIGLSLGCSTEEPDVTIGLITKQEENEYWVTVREVAEETAKQNNVELITITGSSDVDVETQLAALKRMTEQQVDGILIAPTDSVAVVEPIEKAREAGIPVIAIDTPTDPVDAVDATFATDNQHAGELVGQYARARADELGIEPKLAVLDLAPGIASGELRYEGFLEGFGLEEAMSAEVAHEYAEASESLSELAMEEILEEHPDVNIVYAVNEPAAMGAVTALQDADVNMNDIILVTVDGGCEVMKDAVRPGLIDATAQQYPQNMAREGVVTLAEVARGEDEPPTGFMDTGVVLVSGKSAPGVDSRGVSFGVRNCWG